VISRSDTSNILSVVRGCEADHSPPPSAELHASNTFSWRDAQVKQRDNFIFTFTCYKIGGEKAPRELMHSKVRNTSALTVCADLSRTVQRSEQVRFQCRFQVHNFFTYTIKRQNRTENVDTDFRTMTAKCYGEPFTCSHWHRCYQPTSLTVREHTVQNGLPGNIPLCHQILFC
jgi:hypothetical protein